ncbi:hypothetical protein [Thermococcus sp.]|uniref:hypothetical protein n=1 Tax=Thermococcus sp. TaxID=35749 RepID=UPI00262A8B0F|nr:hypothetical protein [Thermococcus sp.]
MVSGYLTPSPSILPFGRREMELRDYLMPGEYILTVFTNLDISPGNFNGLAVTNERIILFSTKSGVGKLSRKNRSEDTKNLKSVFFKNTPIIEMKVYEGVIRKPEDYLFK